MSGEIVAVLPANDPIDLMAFLRFIIQITICLCNFFSLINEHFYPGPKIVPVIMKCSSGNKITIHYTWLIYKNPTTHFKVELTLWNRGPAMTERFVYLPVSYVCVVGCSVTLGISRSLPHTIVPL